MTSPARRHAGLFSALLALLIVPLLAGCPKKQEPAPAKAASVPVKEAPAKAPPQPPAKQQEPKAPPARPMSKAELRPTVPPPAWKVVHKLARAEVGARVTPYAGLKPLGGARFATVLGAPGAQKGRPLLKLAILDRAGTGWTILLHDIHDYAREESGFDEECADAHKVLVSLYVSDYDWDDAPEVKVRHRFKGCDMEDGEGDPEAASPSTHFQLFNAGPPISQSLSALVFHGKGEGHHSERNTKVVHGKDLNGDGHPDLTILFHEKDFACQLGETYHDNRVWIYHWDFKTDTFKLIKKEEESSMVEGDGLDEVE